ncbi:MAG: DNA topoisomerase I [Candidatus Thermoplasmatota archaeon]
MPTLVIAEKNDAAKRIASILSERDFKQFSIDHVPVYHFERNGIEHYTVGLRGHILSLDYPKRFARWHSEDLAALVWAEPERKVAVKHIASALETLAGRCSSVIIATDYDREGELIGVEALWIFLRKTPDAEVKRAKFSAFTKSEVEEAFASLTEVDHALAKAAEARQLIDLAWGAALTRFMSLATGQYGRDFLSVGRVQSPTLALIVKREKEIEGFVPKPYWELVAELSNAGALTAKHEKGVFWDKPAVDDLLSKLTGAKEAVVRSVEIEERREHPPSPFNTTLFLSEASRLGISAPAAMAIAEKLYIAGHISYPRTDNTVYPPSLRIEAVLRELERSPFKAEVSRLLKDRRPYPTRGKVEATDHPPIYPVSAASKKAVKGDAWRIYELVVRRFLATLAPDAVVEDTHVRIEIAGEVFTAQGRRHLSKGWYDYYPYYSPRETHLPPVSVSEVLRVLKIWAEEGETKPPRRFTHGTLVQEMERLGLGTKSTRHEILQKLFERRYVEGGALRATKSGIAVAEALGEGAEQITKPMMTARLEEEMTKIAEGKKDMEGVVAESQQMLSSALAALESRRGEISESVRTALYEQKMLGKCPRCGGDLLVRISKKGKRFVGCSRYPHCDVTYPLPQRGLVVPTTEVCAHCAAPIIKLVNKGRRPRRLCLNMECGEDRGKDGAQMEHQRSSRTPDRRI